MTDLSSWPWPEGAATGIGSLPGTDVAEAQRLVLGELPDLAHLVELPAVGPGADMIGRTAALLVDLPVELYAAAWRICQHGGRDLRIANDHLERGLDTLTELASEYDGTFKIQMAGPLTMAATLALPTGSPVLRDHGAVRDLAASLAEGARAHVAAVRARMPLATVLLQVDEPAMPLVLAGRVPTESGFGTLRAVATQAARAMLADLVTASGVPVVVHCCAKNPPLTMLREAGAVAVSLDLDQFDLGAAADLDGLGEVLDAGMGLFAGVVPATGARVGAVRAAGPREGAGATGGTTAATGATGSARAPRSSAAAAERVIGLWRTLGFDRSTMAAQVVLTPACGLASASVPGARATLAACRDAGRRLVDEARR